MPWTTVVFLAASLWRSVKERLLVKSRSAGERIENFMAYVAELPGNKELMLNGAGYGNRQKSRYCWGSLADLSHEVDALVHSDARRAEVWRLQVFHIASLLAFHGSLLPYVPCAPNNRPFQIRKVDREYILW
jgi:hypothetical protein